MELSEQEGLPIELASIEVAPPSQPPFGYKGSPTVLVNGQDLDPSARGAPDSGHG